MKQIVQNLSPETPAEFAYGLRLEVSNDRFSNSHTHNYCEFCLVISDILRQKCNGKEFDMSAKQLCFIRSSDIHSLIAINCKSAVIYNIGIPQKIMDSVSKMYGIKLEELYRPELPIVVTLLDKEYQSLLTKIELFEKKDFGEAHSYHFINLASEFFFLLCAHGYFNLHYYIEPIEEPPEFLKEILMNLENPECFIEGLPQLLSMTQFSHEYISRTFRKYLNCTPTEYINILRLNYARKLIAEGNCSISEACFKSGFKSESYFFSQFKKVFLCTPREYRESQRRTDS